MDINKLFKDYKVKRFDENDVDEIYDFCLSNPYFYQMCGSDVSKQSIKNDLKLLPDNIDIDNKYYLGIYDQDKLVCITDFLEKYPDDKTIFIGFFMVNGLFSNKGIGSNIINELMNSFKNLGYQYVRLAYDMDNPQSSYFWIKNGFVKIGEKKHEYGKMIIAQRKI